MIGGRDGEAASLYRARNAEASPLRYIDRPAATSSGSWRRSTSAARSSAAIYHSHTASPAYPSQTDINLAESWPDPLYLICSLADAALAGVRAFAIRDERVEEVELDVSARGAECGRRPLACPSARATTRSRSASAPTAGCRSSTRAAASRSRSPTPTSGRARSSPQYTGGELVRVAGGRNQAEAELIQGILLEEGIPSIQRRTRGFDVPDFLAAGPRDVLVPEAADEAARELLVDAELVGEATPDRDPRHDLGPAPLRLRGRRRGGRRSSSSGCSTWRPAEPQRASRACRVWRDSPRSSPGVRGSSSPSGRPPRAGGGATSRSISAIGASKASSRLPWAPSLAQPRDEHVGRRRRRRFALEEVEDGAAEDDRVARRGRESGRAALAHAA